MFSPLIVESDAFLDMPLSSQALYFHLGMYADDDGFVNPGKIMRMLGASSDDLKILGAKNFVLPFENGVLVIKHWRMNNLVRKDWYKPTQYIEEKSALLVKQNGAYTLDTKQGKPLVELPEGNLVNEPLTIRSRRLGKVRLGKDSKDKYGEFENVFLLAEEYQKLTARYGTSAINTLIEECSTYQKSAGKKYSDHYATLLNWAKRKGIVEVPKPTVIKKDEAPLTPEQVKRNAELRAQIRGALPRKLNVKQ